MPTTSDSPVSSVAYAIEAALHALHGDLALLLTTLALVVGLVVVVTANYWQLVRRFPKALASARRPPPVGDRATVDVPADRRGPVRALGAGRQPERNRGRRAEGRSAVT
ncbi:hypothetical protein ACFWIQ_28700 [Kitasatospora sp. NPDC127059]|uniref:hypothetical protein n=1 Tax=unclassified Kitasatospora TaxID=2633591 RepID=UPI00365C871A